MSSCFRFRLASPLVLMVVLLLVPACSDDDPVIPPVEEDPFALSLSRLDWFWASAPFVGDRDPDNRSFNPENRVESVRWFRPKDRVLRRYLDPELINRARDETQPALQLYLRAEDGTWDPEDWGGIMQGISRTGLDLTDAEFFEIWVNDGEPDIHQRRGKLHIDFGFISEDGFWPIDGDGSLVVGKWEFEDANEDGIFTAIDEDIGLDGYEFGPQKYDTSYELNGDSPYPRINGTSRNNREDDEDLDGDERLEYENGYFTTSIDLKETAAQIDVVYDYDSVDDLVNENIAWRKYRIPMDALDSYSDGTQPNLNAVTHVRLWFEDSVSPARTEKTLQFSNMKFVVEN